MVHVLDIANASNILLSCNIHNKDMHQEMLFWSDFPLFPVAFCYIFKLPTFKKLND